MILRKEFDPEAIRFTSAMTWHVQPV